VTVFKSVGVAAQDVAAAHRALMNASRIGLGPHLD
jgi:ornithine cyclodeaminase/alanine dehydrogenase-like protein (mu-crystallin family)